MRHIAIAFTKENYQLAVGIDKKDTELNEIFTQYSDQKDTEAPNMNYYYYDQWNTKQFEMYKLALKFLDELFIPILK